MLASLALFADELVNDGAESVGTVFTIDSTLVLVAVSLLIPLATGLLVKAQASAGVHQIVTLILSAVNGALVTATQLDGTAVLSLDTLFHTALSLAIAIGTYLGIYRPHDTNAKLAPNSGLG